MCSRGLVFKPRGASVGHRIWGGNRCECGFGLCANRVRLTFWSKNLRALCLHSGSSPWLAQECDAWAWGGSTDEVRYEVLNTKCGAWAWGRGERSPSSLLAAAGKQGNDSLKTNHYLRVILCCALRARYH